MLETIFAEANAVTPKAVDEALRITGTRLLGELLAVSDPLADRTLENIKDIAATRSIISRALADASAKGLVRNPEMVAALGHAFTDDFVRKLHNKATVFKMAAMQLSDGTIPSDTYASAPGDDWLNMFQRVCEDASSEKLQDQLSRILAGEINRSGSYSVSTLRVVGELDAHTTDCFLQIYSESLDKIYIYRSEKYSEYPWWDRINSLRDTGLISVSDGAIYNPPVHLGAPDGVGYWSIGAEPTVMIKYKQQGRSEIPVFKMTKAGAEIATLFPSPDYERNLRLMVEDNPFKGGWIEANLLIGGHIGELLYSE